MGAECLAYPRLGYYRSGTGDRLGICRSCVPESPENLVEGLADEYQRRDCPSVLVQSADGLLSARIYEALAVICSCQQAGAVCESLSASVIGGLLFIYCMIRMKIFTDEELSGLPFGSALSKLKKRREKHGR